MTARYVFRIVISHSAERFEIETAGPAIYAVNDPIRLTFWDDDSGSERRCISGRVEASETWWELDADPMKEEADQDRDKHGTRHRLRQFISEVAVKEEACTT